MGKMSFYLLGKRRRVIVVHARYVDAMDTEDRDRWLIAWVWHNRSQDQVGALIWASQRMGRKWWPGISESEAEEMIASAKTTPKRTKADELAVYLGLKYAVRQQLGISTIGSIDVGPQARRELRKRRQRLRMERNRRAKGVKKRVCAPSLLIAAHVGDFVGSHPSRMLPPAGCAR
jgi:hypothetical protein